MSFSTLSVNSVWFLISENSYNLTSNFPLSIQELFIFCCLFALARTPKTMPNKSCKGRHFCSIQDLKKKSFRSYIKFILHPDQFLLLHFLPLPPLLSPAPPQSISLPFQFRNEQTYPFLNRNGERVDCGVGTNEQVEGLRREETGETVFAM